LKSKSKQDLPEKYISIADHIRFTTAEEDFAYGFFYAPRNPEFHAPTGTLPPLIVYTHGGPTGCTTRSFSSEIQYWTTRGFAVVDINYRGSTGYGRKYRQGLDRDADDKPGYWGIADIQDCEACLNYLVAQRLADPSKVFIRGRSAGGYTTLAALAFTDVFKGGASYYGVSDMYALAQDTHKFESKYLDILVGDLPALKEVYDQRSPINNLKNFTAPIILFQGDEDKVVPPSQAELMLDALRAKDVPVEYVLYKGEQHGVRKAENIADALNKELAFYQGRCDAS